MRRLAAEPCPPDVFGINHYLTSERFLDERRHRYPEHTYGGNGRHEYADVEAVRVLGRGCAGVGALLTEAWRRYHAPVAITEAHLGCTPEEQARWLTEVWSEAKLARERGGADVPAVTVWSLFGATDWDSLLTRQRGSYEPGVWDARGRPEPRPTALVPVCRALARGEEPDLPVLDGAGWWRRPARLLYPPEDAADAVRLSSVCETAPKDARPLLIFGARGLLGAALARACGERGIACVALGGRAEADIASPAAVERALEEHEPWAVVNAAGFANVWAAETEPYACRRANVVGPAVLARACAGHGLPLLLFSSALVLDGEAAAREERPLVEGDPLCPRGAYARTKAEMERVARAEMPGALVIRTSALFGPWGEGDFLTRALVALADGQTVYAADDDFLTPAYLPDLAHRALDLFVDGAAGVWHLAHPEPVSRAGLIRRAARLAGIPDAGLRAVPSADLGADAAASPSRWAVLGTERLSAPLLPPLDAALAHYAGVSEPVVTAARVAQVRREARRLLDRGATALRW
jgi:dTDP-4-dehydrorhamnose reductase